MTVGETTFNPLSPGATPFVLSITGEKPSFESIDPLLLFFHFLNRVGEGAFDWEPQLK
jgi:hypothetical protein